MEVEGNVFIFPSDQGQIQISTFEQTGLTWLNTFMLVG